MVQLVLPLEQRGAGRPTPRTRGAGALMVTRQVVLPPPRCEWLGSGPQTWPLDHCTHEPIVVIAVGTMGIICNLGSAEARDLKCVILGLKMTYTAGLGFAEPSLIKNANAPLFHHMQNTTHHPFFRQNDRVHYGPLSAAPGS